MIDSAYLNPLVIVIYAVFFKCLMKRAHLIPFGEIPLRQYINQVFIVYNILFIGLVTLRTMDYITLTFFIKVLALDLIAIETLIDLTLKSLNNPNLIEENH